MQDDHLIDAGDRLFVTLAARRGVELAGKRTVADREAAVGAERHAGIAEHARGGRCLGAGGGGYGEEEGEQKAAHAASPYAHLFSIGPEL